MGRRGVDEFKTTTHHSADLRYGGEIGPDGEEGWHEFRFDWHTGGNGERKRVDFYIDGVLNHSSDEDPFVVGPLSPFNASSDSAFVPTKGGRIWIGGKERFTKYADIYMCIFPSLSIWIYQILSNLIHIHQQHGFPMPTTPSLTIPFTGQASQSSISMQCC